MYLLFVSNRFVFLFFLLLFKYIVFVSVDLGGELLHTTVLPGVVNKVALNSYELLLVMKPCQLVYSACLVVFGGKHIPPAAFKLGIL